MSAHTSGPWKVLPDEGKGYLRIRGILGRRFKIANVLNPNLSEQRQSEANAWLISAAPDLLAIVRRMNQQGGHGLDEHAAMQAAILKAEGRAE